MVPLYATLMAFGFDLFIADFVIVCLGNSLMLRNWFSVRGYYFDYDFQDQWDDKVKFM